MVQQIGTTLAMVGQLAEGIELLENTHDFSQPLRAVYGGNAFGLARVQDNPRFLAQMDMIKREVEAMARQVRENDANDDYEGRLDAAAKVLAP